jgi:citrate lyase subunit beta/citryl-CoA lyase
MIAILESALGVSRSEQIYADAPARLFTVCFGVVDFALDVGTDLTGDLTEALYARSRIVIAARAGGLAAPIDGPWLWLDDDDGLVADTMRSRRVGFEARVVVYPSEVEHVQRGYGAMSEDEIGREKKIVETFEQALAKGTASVRIDGVFVDYPIYERAKKKLDGYRGSQGAP